MKSIWPKIKRRPWLALGTVAVVIAAGLFLFRGGPAEPATIRAERGNLREEVSVTGKTKAHSEIELAFEKSGRVARVPVAVGDRIAAGGLLISLNTADLAADLREAEASLASQEAKLAELIRGSRPEEIEAKRSELAAAQQDLVNLYASTPNILQTAYAKAEQAVRDYLDDLFTNDDQTNVQLSFSTASSQTKINAEVARAVAGRSLAEWQTELAALMPNDAGADQEAALAEGSARLIQYRNLANLTSDALLTAAGLSASTQNSYQSDLNSARVNLNTALTSVSDHNQEIGSQKITVDRIRHELDLKLAGTAPEVLTAQRAAVLQAEARVQSIQVQLGKTSLRSPIDGIVTRLEASPGELVAVNSVVAAVISAADYEIEANIPEADIAKVTVGDPAEVTLDAYGEVEIFTAKVVQIDPAETVIEGVSTYKASLVFAADDPRVRPGLTANVNILTDVRNDVVVVPQRSVFAENGSRYVLIYRGPAEEAEKRIVEVGLRGADGNLEIVSGLTADEEILRSQPE